MAVQVLAFGAEGADDLGFYLFEGGCAGFLDFEDFDEVESVAELDGAGGGAFGEAGEGFADGGLDGVFGEESDFASVGSAAGFVAVGFGEGGEVAGFYLFGEGVGFCLGFGGVGAVGDEDLGKAVLLGQAEFGLAGVVDFLDFGIRGEVGGDFGDGFEVALGDGCVSHAGEEGLGVGLIVPVGVAGFFEEDLLEDEGADCLAEGGGVLLEGGAVGFAEAGEVGLDLRDGDVAVAGSGDDGVGGVGGEGE